MFCFSKYFFFFNSFEIGGADRQEPFLLEWANNIDSYLKVSLHLRVLPEAGMWLQLSRFGKIIKKNDRRLINDKEEGLAVVMYIRM